MTKNVQQLAITGFVDGLNTEASALNVLPSEMMDGSVNVELFQNGSVRRRRGIDFIGESSATGFLQELRSSTTGAETAAEAPNAVLVRLTAPNGTTVIRIVADVNNEFHVYNATNEGLRNVDAPVQTLTRDKSHSSQKFYRTSFSQSGNRLYFAGLRTQPGYIQVASDNTSLEIVYTDVLIRNTGATSQNSAVKVGSAWYECIETHTSATADNRPGSGTNWERYWFQKPGSAPTSVSAWADATSYSSSIIKRYNKLTTPTASSTYPTTVTFYAGRVWLAGDPKYSNDVYFSQVVVNDRNLEKYMQEADPFYTDDPDLVDNDGGVISMQGAGLTYQLLAINTSLFIGTDTSIWQITGADGIFKATSFSNNLVLDDPIEGNNLMQRVEDELYIFGQNNIWKSEINTNAASTLVGSAAFTSLSEERIQTYYQALPNTVKQTASVVYNPSDKRVYYWHNKVATDYLNSYANFKQPCIFTHCMVIDTRFKEDILQTTQDPAGLKRRVNGAFFLYEYADGGATGLPFIAAPFVSIDVPAANDPVISNGEAVISNGEDVITSAKEEASNVVLALVLQRVTTGSTVVLNYAFATMNTEVLRDWISSATYAVSYDSVIRTGFQIMGNVMLPKSMMYLYFLFKKVESGVLDVDGFDLTPGGCFVSTAYNFSSNSSHPKYSSQRQVYYPTRNTYAVAGSGGDDDTHVWRKHRVRGRGDSMYVIFENDGDKDFHILGWSQMYHTGSM